MVRKSSTTAGANKASLLTGPTHQVSHALDRGAPAHLIQQILGDQSLATTSRYTHARPDDSSGQYLGM